MVLHTCDRHESDLYRPATKLVTFNAFRRRNPPVRIPTADRRMARRRRVIHAVFGIVVGFLVGLLFTSRGVFRNWGYSVVNGTCATQNSYNIKNPPHLRNVGLPAAEDPFNIIRMSDPGETIHNSRRSLLFVGVMTAQKYLETRAVAVYETWGRELPGRVAFFTSEASVAPPNRGDLPLVRLRGVDDSYPPQKKSFLMLQYMWEHYGDRFEWFLRADDDVYIRPDKLERLLRSVDSRKPQFIGQAGRGNQEEFGLLSLEYDENFCMGGPGIIMSRETLARVAPHIKYCLKNLYTTHEDVELGRCVQKFAGIPCTWSYEMQAILYHNSSGVDAFTGNLKQKEVHRAITLHPIKQHQHMYRVHNYMKALKIQDLQHNGVKLHRDLLLMAAMLGVQPEQVQDMELSKNVPLFPHRMGSRHYLGDTAMLGLPPGLNKHRPKEEREVLEWDFIARSLFSHTNSNPRRRVESPLREGLEDVIREVMGMINMYSKQRGRVIEYREILYGYTRLSPQYGADYILDLLLVYKKYRGRKMTVPVRRHVYLQQQFTGLEIRETFEGIEVKPPANERYEHHTEDAADNTSPDNFQNTIRNALHNGFAQIGQSLPVFLQPSETKQLSVANKIIHFVLPLSGRFQTFLRFISVFERVCLHNNERVTLTLVLFPSKTENSFNQTVNVMTTLQTQYRYTRISVVPVYEHFARAKALELGISQCNDNSSLLFFVDVDIVFTSGTLNRIRTNTIQSRQAYFPIVYSEFDPSVVLPELGSPSTNHFNINDDTGYWRQFGFGIASIYKSDLRAIGGFNTTIQGWGKEDVDLYDKVVTSTTLKVFRTADPSIVHVFHIVECDPKLEPTQLKMCRGTRVDTYGGVKQLAEYMFNNKDIFQYAKYKNKDPS